MIPLNYYPVSFTDFLEAKKVGNYPTFYCILDDRIHMERPIENGTFVSCVFIESIEKEYGKDMTQEPVDMFIKSNLKDGLSFRYYPTQEMVKELKKIEYYKILSATKLLNKSFDENKLKLTEDDDGIHLTDGAKRVLSLEKGE